LTLPPNPVKNCEYQFPNFKQGDFMKFLGIQLTLLLGQTVPKPAPSSLREALESAEVTHSDEGRSGFQLSFRIGRSGASDLKDYSLLSSGLLQPFNRVILIVTFNAKPNLLMDGLITHQQLLPSNYAGESKFIVTGEDVSVMMDLEEKIVEHPAQNETAIATKIIANYAKYGLIPKVIPPPTDKPPLPTERVPIQHGTDLEYLQKMAQRHAYVFYVTPGPVPGTNTAYWGPPNRKTAPQPALSVNMGTSTNIASIEFQYNALAATLVAGQLQDRESNKSRPVKISTSALPPLAKLSALKLHSSSIRKVIPQGVEGLNESQAKTLAQAITDASLDKVVTAQGELDTLSYGGLLQARSLVGLRGAGDSYDGLYYVKSVTHRLHRGKYAQNFTLTREGLGAIAPIVKI
jgi:hypothetical protein